jgi:hypothetical protein
MGQNLAAALAVGLVTFGITWIVLAILSALIIGVEINSALWAFLLGLAFAIWYFFSRPRVV